MVVGVVLLLLLLMLLLMIPNGNHSGLTGPHEPILMKVQGINCPHAWVEAFGKGYKRGYNG